MGRLFAVLTVLVFTISVVSVGSHLISDTKKVGSDPYADIPVVQIDPMPVAKIVSKPKVKRKRAYRRRQKRVKKVIAHVKKPVQKSVSSEFRR
jgi:hypothetical protein